MTTRRPPSNAKWTPEQDDDLVRLCKAGLSASQIAGHFEGLSRNAVIGRIYRLRKAGKLDAGLQGLSPAQRSASAARAKAAQKTTAAKPKMKLVPGVPMRAVKAKPKPAPKPEPEPVIAVAPEPAIVVAPEAPSQPADDIEKIGKRAWAFDPLPGRAPVPSMPAGGGICCWPTNGLLGREPVCCGAPAPLTRPYCAAHARIAYNPAPLKELRHGA